MKLIVHVSKAEVIVSRAGTITPDRGKEILRMTAPSPGTVQEIAALVAKVVGDAVASALTLEFGGEG